MWRACSEVRTVLESVLSLVGQGNKKYPPEIFHFLLPLLNHILFSCFDVKTDAPSLLCQVLLNCKGYHPDNVDLTLLLIQMSPLAKAVSHLICIHSKAFCCLPLLPNRAEPGPHRTMEKQLHTLNHRLFYCSVITIGHRYHTRGE